MADSDCGGCGVTDGNDDMCLQISAGRILCVRGGFVMERADCGHSERRIASTR